MRFYSLCPLLLKFQEILWSCADKENRTDGLTDGRKKKLYPPQLVAWGLKIAVYHMCLYSYISSSECIDFLDTIWVLFNNLSNNLKETSETYWYFLRRGFSIVNHWLKKVFCIWCMVQLEKRNSVKAERSHHSVKIPC